MKKWKCVIFKCYSSENLITLNILHEVVPTRYSFHSWVDWSNADKVSCSRRRHTAAGVRTVYLCIQNRHSSQPTNMQHVTRGLPSEPPRSSNLQLESMSLDGNNLEDGELLNQLLRLLSDKTGTIHVPVGALQVQAVNEATCHRPYIIMAISITSVIIIVIINTTLTIIIVINYTSLCQT